LNDPVLVLDMETDDAMEVTPDYVRHEYGRKIDAHVAAMSDRAQRAGFDYFLLNTGRPLDDALREYLSIRLRQGRR
jgi:hypothetical protein